MSEEEGSKKEDSETEKEDSEETQQETEQEERKEEESAEEKEKKPKIRFKKVPAPYFAALAIVAIVFFFAGYLANSGSPTTGMVVGDVIPAQQAAAEAIDYINNYLLSPGTSASLIEVTDEGYNYEIKFKISGSAGESEFSSYVTKDGKILFVSAVDMSVIPEETEETQPEPPEVVKSEKPVAHAFVMSYCPYGLQFIKAYVPVIELLGDKADLELNFVPYAMHGKEEIDENLRMYCIQKETDKLTDYLRCFVEKDDWEGCMDQVGIDKTKIEACVASTDEEFNITGLYNDQGTWSGGTYPLFPIDQALANKYSVRGSPTFVLNDKTISVNRSPEAIKQAVCEAFIDPPEECETVLSTTAESPGIGPIGSGEESGSSGQC